MAPLEMTVTQPAHLMLRGHARDLDAPVHGVGVDVELEEVRVGRDVDVHLGVDVGELDRLLEETLLLGDLQLDLHLLLVQIIAESCRDLR